MNLFSYLLFQVLVGISNFLNVMAKCNQKSNGVGVGETHSILEEFKEYGLFNCTMLHHRFL